MRTQSVLEDPKNLTIRLFGSLDSGTAIQFTQEIPTLDERQNVILDCGGLDLIDGTGMIALMVFIGHLSKMRCSISIINLEGQPLELFKTLGLYKLYCNTNRFGWTSMMLSSFIKRALDIVISLLVLTLFLVPGLLLCIAIPLESRGWPIYAQKRMKRHYRKSYNDLRDPGETDTFNIYKFRTMVKNAESITGAVNAKENDPRVTRIGRILRKTRLDEIPNFINVLKGDMSIVGPRADRPDILNEVKNDFPLVYERCRFVKPGITGLAQLYLKSDGTLPSKNIPLAKCLPDTDKDKEVRSFRYKLYYEAAYAMSLYGFFHFIRTEFVILLKTPIVMFFRQNVI